MRFLAPPALQVRKIHSPGALPAPYGPPSGFLSLLTAYALPNPAGLVSCRRHSWGCTLQSLSLRTKPWRLSTPATLMPLACRLPPAPRPPRSIASPLALRLGVPRSPPCWHPPAGSAPGPGTSPESVDHTAVLPAARPRCSHGLPASPGPSARRVWAPASRRLLPWACRSATLPRLQAAATSSLRVPYGVSIDSAAAPPPLGGGATLMRFSNLIYPLEGSKR
jgi:hypothetical protein